MKKLSLIIIIALIVISNFVPTLEIEVYYFQTINKEYEYLVVPSKGGSLEAMNKDFDYFKSKSNKYKDLILYRTFEKNIWKFWKWRDYLLNSVWNYPILE